MHKLYLEKIHSLQKIVRIPCLILLKTYIVFLISLIFINDHIFIAVQLAFLNQKKEIENNMHQFLSSIFGVIFLKSKRILKTKVLKEIILYPLVS